MDGMDIEQIADPLYAGMALVITVLAGVVVYQQRQIYILWSRLLEAAKSYGEQIADQRIVSEANSQRGEDLAKTLAMVAETVHGHEGRMDQRIDRLVDALRHDAAEDRCGE